MAKQLVWELFEVEAETPEDAVAEVKANSLRTSVVSAASSLDALPHPVHLAESQEKFGFRES